LIIVEDIALFIFCIFSERLIRLLRSVIMFFFYPMLISLPQLEGHLRNYKFPVLKQAFSNVCFHHFNFSQLIIDTWNTSISNHFLDLDFLTFSGKAQAFIFSFVYQKIPTK
jgi:hypothetical protein